MAKQKNGRQNYDWEAIKLDYMNDPKLSLRKIAKKYGIRIHTVEKRAAADGWYQAKRQYQQEMTSEIVTRVFDNQAEVFAKELQMIDIVSDMLLNTLLTDKDQLRRHIVRTGRGEEEKVFTKMDTGAMLNMTKAVKLMVDLKKSILGIPSLEHLDRMEISRGRMQIERERLDFEKEKLNMLRPSGEKQEIGIVVLPAVLDEDPEQATQRAKLLEEWSS